MSSKVIIYKANKELNWEYFDGECNIPVYGTGFKTTEDTIKDFKKHAKELNIKGYKLEIENEVK